MWKTLMSKLSAMLQETGPDEAWSSTRFSFIVTVLVSNFIVFGLIAYNTILTGSLPDVPEGLIWIYALANGISFAGKVAQKFKENGDG